MRPEFLGRNNWTMNTRCFEVFIILAIGFTFGMIFRSIVPCRTALVFEKNVDITDITGTPKVVLHVIDAETSDTLFQIKVVGE